MIKVEIGSNDVLIVNGSYELQINGEDLVVYPKNHADEMEASVYLESGGKDKAKGKKVKIKKMKTLEGESVKIRI